MTMLPPGSTEQAEAALDATPGADTEESVKSRQKDTHGAQPPSKRRKRRQKQKQPQQLQQMQPSGSHPFEVDEAEKQKADRAKITSEGAPHNGDVIAMLPPGSTKQAEAAVDATPGAETEESEMSRQKDTHSAHPPSKREKRRQKQKQPQQTQPSGSHPFEVDAADHCETPLRAYQDLAVVLDHLLRQKERTDPRHNLRDDASDPRKLDPPARSSLRIYDPYYCDGGAKAKLAALGFTNVIHENRDFYQDVDSGRIPDHDVLVTNPPYSGRHIERLLAYCATREGKEARPALLLLPHFVYTKGYYAQALELATRGTAAEARPREDFFSFLVPQTRYSYAPPAWAHARAGASLALARGKDTTAPFPSFWYCCRLAGARASPAAEGASRRWLEATFGAAGSVRSGHASGLRYARVPREIPRDFKVRPNECSCLATYMHACISMMTHNSLSISPWLQGGVRPRKETTQPAGAEAAAKAGRGGRRPTTAAERTGPATGKRPRKEKEAEVLIDTVGKCSNRVTVAARSTFACSRTVF